MPSLRKASRAILAVAPDARQEKILARVMPSWRRYADRHALEIVVVRRSITGGKHPYWDRWLTIQEGEPEVASYDDLLLLDNDIFITDGAPDVFDYRGTTGIAIVQESAQGNWNIRQIPSYYRRFHVEADDRLPNPTKVFNVGVCVLARGQRSLFKLLYAKWRQEIQPRFTSRELKQKDIFYRLEADGPFLSYELQARGQISPLPATFNFFLPAWLGKNDVRQLPFLFQAKAAQKLAGKFPRPLMRKLIAPARTAIERAAAECYFLHFAASKSPLWLLPDAQCP